MNTSMKSGLRDRKRAQTRTRLEEAAVTLVLRDGLEATTIEAISELADVSPRTFFNYFESKDSAILGMRNLEMSEEAAAEYVAGRAGADLVESVVHLLFTVMDAPPPRPTIREDRLEIIRRHPHVLGSQLAQMTQLSGRLTAAVQGLLASDPRFAGRDATEQAAWADLLLATCSGAVKVAVRDTATVGLGADDQQLEQRATALVQQMMEMLR